MGGETGSFFVASSYEEPGLSSRAGTSQYNPDSQILDRFPSWRPRLQGCVPGRVLVCLLFFGCWAP